MTQQRRIGGRDYDFSRQIAIMAIINRTPDSFYDRGATFALHAAVSAAERALTEGADWIDVGGVPYALRGRVPVAEEIRRVVPVIRALASSPAVLSVDTCRADVARAALQAGAHVINDTSGLADPEMAGVLADSDASVVITHSRDSSEWSPAVLERPPVYDDVVADVVGFLRNRVEHALAAGIGPERIILDPGHDLDKNTLHSLELAGRLSEIVELGFPTLVALSNKDFVGESLGRDREERLAGSLAVAVHAVLNGARIVRVHNVSETVDAIRMIETILGWREPVFLRHNMPTEARRPAGGEK